MLLIIFFFKTRICKPIDNDNLESFGNMKKGCPTNGGNTDFLNI